MTDWQWFLVIFLGIAVIGLLLSGIVYAIASLLSLWFDRRQTKALKVLARDWGFNYRENVRLDTPDTDWRFQFFSYGRDRKIKKLLQGKKGNVTILIGNYSYVTSNNSKRQTHYHTVVVMQSPHLTLPSFILIPGNRFEQFIFKTFGVFAYDKIKFKGHPKFASGYLLGGSDEAAIRECFQEGVLSFYEQQKYTYSEGMGAFLVYGLMYSLSTKKWKDFINTALEAHEQFVQRY